MTDTVSRYLQSEAVVVEQAWDSGLDSASFIDGSMLFVVTSSTASLANPSIVSPYSAETTSRVSQTPSTAEDWRAALKARYKAMPNTAWFKAAHEDRSLGEAVKIS